MVLPTRCPYFSGRRGLAENHSHKPILSGHPDISPAVLYVPPCHQHHPFLLGLCGPRPCPCLLPRGWLLRLCNSCDSVSVQSLSSLGPKKCSNSGVSTFPTESPCSCPRRVLPPETPPVLPCAPTPDNVPQLKQFILERQTHLKIYPSNSKTTCI